MLFEDIILFVVGIITAILLTGFIKVNIPKVECVSDCHSNQKWYKNGKLRIGKNLPAVT